jgi:hypothetical protein
MKDMIVPEWMAKVVYFALGFMVCFTLVITKGIV